MAEENCRYIFIQTLDRLYSVEMCGDYQLPDSPIRVDVNFPEENYPIGGALSIVNGQIWMIGGEKIRRGILPPYNPVKYCIDTHFKNADQGNCRTVYHVCTHDKKGKRATSLKILPDKFMHVGKPNPISHFFGDKLYVFPGPSLFPGRCTFEGLDYEGVDYERLSELYDPASGSWETLPQLPGFSPLYYFFLGKKLYFHTQSSVLGIFDTRDCKWSGGSHLKLNESFEMFSDRMPVMGRDLKLKNPYMHVIFGFSEYYPYAYLVSVADDVDNDDNVYLRCIQPLDGLHPEKDNPGKRMYGGVFVPLQDGTMCCICGYCKGPSKVEKRRFYIFVTIFSATSVADSIPEPVRGFIFQSERVRPGMCYFLDINIISSRTYVTPEERVDINVRQALIY